MASLVLGTSLIPAGCQAQTLQTPMMAAPAPIVGPVVANAVRIYPRAGFASHMVGGEIQGSNESATAGFVTLAKITKAPREGA